MLKSNKKKILKLNDINGQEPNLRAITLHLKKYIKGSTQKGSFLSVCLEDIDYKIFRRHKITDTDPGNDLPASQNASLSGLKRNNLNKHILTKGLFV